MTNLSGQRDKQLHEQEMLSPAHTTLASKQGPECWPRVYGARCS